MVLKQFPWIYLILHPPSNYNKISYKRGYPYTVINKLIQQIIAMKTWPVSISSIFTKVVDIPSVFASFIKPDFPKSCNTNF